MTLKIVFAALLAATVARADAAALVLWPIDPKIEGSQTATSLWLENRGTSPVTLQIRSLGWGQSGGEDQYVRQGEVVASPPIAKVAPGERQLVRIIRRAADTTAAERSYRLLIDELPAPLGDAEVGHPRAQLAVQMRYSIPLFTYGTPDRGQPALSGRVVLADGQRFLEVRNRGTHHARLVNLRLKQGQNFSPITPGLVGYVLSGAMMRWPLSGAIFPGSSFVVNVNGVDVVLDENA